MAEWKAKEYYTVLIDGIPVRMLAEYLRGTLGMSGNSVVRSHFYTNADGDFVYSDSMNLDAYFTEHRGATVHLKTIRFDREYRDGTCMLYSDGYAASVECDIEEKNFDVKRMPELQAWLKEQVYTGIAEYVSISYTADNGPLFEFRQGESL